MKQDDDNLTKTVEAIHDLSQLLDLSHDAALRLKKEIPSKNFPVAYKLAKSIQVLRNAIDELEKTVDDPMLNSGNHNHQRDLISSSDRL